VATTTAGEQIARVRLGAGNLAVANIANVLQHQGDDRSLIGNATGVQATTPSRPRAATTWSTETRHRRFVAVTAMTSSASIGPRGCVTRSGEEPGETAGNKLELMSSKVYLGDFNAARSEIEHLKGNGCAILGTDRADALDSAGCRSCPGSPTSMPTTSSMVLTPRTSSGVALAMTISSVETGPTRVQGRCPRTGRHRKGRDVLESRVAWESWFRRIQIGSQDDDACFTGTSDVPCARRRSLYFGSVPDNRQYSQVYQERVMHLAAVRNSAHSLEHLSQAAEEARQPAEISCPGSQVDSVDLAPDGQLISSL